MKNSYSPELNLEISAVSKSRIKSLCLLNQCGPRVSKLFKPLLGIRYALEVVMDKLCCSMLTRISVNL